MEHEQINQRLASSRAALAWVQFQRQAQPSREYKVFHALRTHMIGCWSELDVHQSVLSRVRGIALL